MRKMTMLVVALVVALVALPSVAIAAADGKIGSWKIRDNSVRSADVRDGTLRLHDLNGRTRAVLSKPGPEGPAGPAGADGSDGVSGYEVVGRSADASAESGLVTAVSKCADGDVVVSGGVKAANPAEVTIHSSYPSDVTQVGESTEDDPAGRWAATSWTTEYTNTGSGSVQPYLICMDSD